MSRLRKLAKQLSGPSGDIDRVLFLLWSMIVIGLLSLLIPASGRLSKDGWEGALTTVAAGLFLAGASTVGGSAIGFLFGVPRHRESGNEAELHFDPMRYRPNTNLEQISDWLTKIFVGAGLTHLETIKDFFVVIGNKAGPAFGAEPVGQIVAISVVIHYLLVGFFQGFLLAYLWLPGAFARAMASLREESNDE